MMAVLVGFSFLPQILWADAPASRIDLATTLNLPWLANQVEILEDPSRQLDLAAVLQLPDNHWRRTPDPVLNPGFSTTAWWVRFTLVNSGASSRQRILEVGWPLLDLLDVHLLDQGVVVQSWSTGDQRPFAQRPLPSRTFAFPLELAPGETRLVVLRLALNDGVYDHIPLRLWEPNAFWAAARQFDLLVAGYYGLVLALLLYNLLLFLSTRDGHFLRYTAYLSLVLIWNIGFLGYGYQYLWPDRSWWNNLINLPLTWLVHIGATGFVTYYLETRRRMPLLHRAITGGTLLMGLPAGLALADTLGVTVPIVAAIYGFVALSMLLLLMYLSAGVVALCQGFRPARYFVIAWSFMIIGALIYQVMGVTGVAATDELIAHSFNVGSALEILFLALALGDRFNQLQNDRLALERQAREMQTAYATTLEYRVEERTRELRQAMQQVSAALDLEQRAQLEQREFLATVSHELRTPLTVIDMVAQNLELEAVDADAQTRRRYEKILQATGRLAILLDNYLDEDRFSLARRGVQRQPCDLRALLADAAAAAQLLADRHTLRVDDHEVPESFACDPDLTRLALRSLADNAVKYTPPGTVIVLRGGRTHDGGVWLEVVDAGPGLTEAELARVFEPHVRGAAAGRHTGHGLGLPLARRMIESQGGTLSAASPPGQGCRFRIELPGADAVDPDGEG